MKLKQGAKKTRNSSAKHGSVSSSRKTDFATTRGSGSGTVTTPSRKVKVTSEQLTAEDDMLKYIHGE